VNLKQKRAQLSLVLLKLPKMSLRETVKVVEKFDLNQLIHNHIEKSGTDESFFIVDVGDVIRKFILWCDLFPRIDPDFAFKCNNHPSVAGTLAALGDYLRLENKTLFTFPYKRCWL
jgi:hypothetical protein